jgi:antitoxin VapB
VEEEIPLRNRFAALRAAHPLPPATGDKADKRFFDDLSGGL